MSSKPATKSRGRPALPEEEKTVTTSVRVTPARRDKLRRLGSAWLNKAIDRAKEPTEGAYNEVFTTATGMFVLWVASLLLCLGPSQLLRQMLRFFPAMIAVSGLVISIMAGVHMARHTQLGVFGIVVAFVAYLLAMHALGGVDTAIRSHLERTASQRS